MSFNETKSIDGIKAPAKTALEEYKRWQNHIASNLSILKPNRKKIKIQ